MTSETASASRLNSLFESVSSVQPILSPPQPTEITEFKKLSKYEQDKNKEFWQSDKIKKYLDDKGSAELHNRDAILWLCQYRDENMQPEEEHAIKTKLNQFLSIIEDQKNIYPALRIDMIKLKLNFWRERSENIYRRGNPAL